MQEKREWSEVFRIVKERTGVFLYPKGIVTLLVIIIWFVCFSEVLIAGSDGFTVGSAKINITPKKPIPMSGYGSRKDPFKGVHDELFARAIVIGDGTRKAAIVSVDVIGLSHDAFQKVTDRIKEVSGIEPDHVLLCPAHNHGGPVTNVYNKTKSRDVEAYVAELHENIATVVKEASGRLESARIGVGRGECLMNINRRARHPQQGITLGRNPYGPCDHEVAVVLIADAQGNPVTVLFNWACHGTVMGPQNYLITGDWPGAAARFIETTMGGRVIAPVIIGASGDINAIYGPHIDFKSVYSSYSYGVDSIGMILGEEVIRVARDIPLDCTGPLRAAQRVIELPRKKQESNLKSPGTDSDDFLKVRLSVLKIGTIILAGVSGEVFTEIGMQLKDQSPYKNTFMVTHCNGSSGYLITDDAYEAGGYEARVTRVQSGAQKAIVSTLLDMINSI
ncbi:MAG: neutral/alkaline non-lysosomal ceramidase N-terminal domain-containing protein [Sedimentisphaerales bacterium]|nr:neutral/alkaline non-lysosomal ceramidase N-terminal domain-containing protein [Sedimentisphaerales bacterium]